MEQLKSFNYYLKTPLRISLFGGGTDFDYFFRDYESNIVSFTINKFNHVNIKNHNASFFNEKYRLNYSNTELTNSIKKIKNIIIKKTIEYKNFNQSFFLSTINDVPSGTGLGSSSAFTTGLVKLIDKINNIKNSKFQNALDASKIEINLCKFPIGYQDQFAASFTGFNHFYFFKNKKKIKKLDKYKYIIEFLSKRSLLLWTGSQRKNMSALISQKKKINLNINKLIELNKICKSFLENINNFNYKNFIYLFQKSSEIKNLLSEKTTNAHIRKLSENKLFIASKILGAGDGGFMLCFFKNPKVRDNFLKTNPNSCSYQLYKSCNNEIKIL